MQSGAGIYTVGALLSYQISDDKNVGYFIDRVKQYSEQCLTESNQSVSLVSGVAGYLYCLLTLHINIQNIEEKNLKQLIIKTINWIYQTGKNNSEDPTVLIWKRHDQVFLGAIHGAVGSVYMMLRGINIIGQ